jgi:hypothetical protein
MSGPRDKHDDGDLDELVHDFDLDMDAPLGASFAAALRGGDEEEEITEFDQAYPIEEEGGFVVPQEAARPQAVLEQHDESIGYDEDQHDEHDTAEFDDMPPPASLAGAQPWLQPKPSQPPAEDLPPMTAHEA